MPIDNYAEAFNLLNTHLLNRSFNQSFAELGGIARELPTLQNVVVDSCYLKHHLSNNLEKKWVRTLHIALNCTNAATAVHHQFRELANDDLSLTFANNDETVLSTQYGRETIAVQAFAQQNVTKVFLQSELSGFTPAEAQSFLLNPLAALTTANPMPVRLVCLQTTRPSENQPTNGRILEQRWNPSLIETLMRAIIKEANGTRWRLMQDIHQTDTGSAARLTHLPSGDVIVLDTTQGYGKLELRARLDAKTHT